MSAAIHPTAIIASGARIAPGVSVGPCAVIEDDVVIGEGSQIHAFASVKQYTRLGRNTTIHSYAAVGGVPQDLKFAGEESWLEMGDGNTVREFATLHRGTAGGGGVTRIGDNNLFMAYTHVAHDCQLGNHIIMSNGATLAGHVTVEDHCILGGLCAVHQFVRIGTHAFVGGMTGVAQDLPPYMLATGPHGGLHGPNLVGLRRMGIPPENVTAMRTAFRKIWLSGTGRKEALEEVRREFGDIPQVRELVDFVTQSSRGILPLFRKSETSESDK